MSSGWDMESRSAIVVVKKDASALFDRNYFMWQMEKNSVSGKVLTVQVPVDIHIEHGVDWESQQTGIVTFDTAESKLMLKTQSWINVNLKGTLFVLP